MRAFGRFVWFSLISVMVQLCVAVGISATPVYASTSEGVADRDYGHLQVRKIVFPIPSATAEDFTDDFGVQRESWSHKGQDIFQYKRAKVVAATDGWVTNLLVAADATGPGNMIEITDADGWKTEYMHLNNDMPGVDDNSNPPDYRFAPGIALGSVVKAGDFIGYVGDSGDAETTPPHLHFEIRDPQKVSINPHPSLRLALGLTVGSRCAYDKSPPGRPAVNGKIGYARVDGDGSVEVFAGPTSAGVRSALARLSGIGVVAASKNEADTFWIVRADGQIDSTGSAVKLNRINLWSTKAPISQAIATSGGGLWVISANGDIAAVGDARPVPSKQSERQTLDVVGAAPTPTGAGMWLAHRDGTVTPIGDAPSASTAGFGAALAERATDPVVSIASLPRENGFVTVSQTGVVATFGEAKNLGSLEPATSGLCKPRRVLSITYTSSGNGYWIATADGNIWSYGDAVRLGRSDADVVSALPPGGVVAVAVSVVGDTKSPSSAARPGPSKSGHADTPGTPWTLTATGVFVIAGSGWIVFKRRKHQLASQRKVGETKTLDRNDACGVGTRFPG